MLAGWALLVFAAAGFGCAVRPAIDEHALIARIREFEARLPGISDADQLTVLRSFAHEMVHQRVRVGQATVVAVYERGTDWYTQPFFGFDYVEAHYVRLFDLDPTFDRRLKATRHWASVACTTADRQLMFELAMDPDRGAALRPGQHISFTCEVAGVIRGKTVYSRLVAMGGSRLGGVRTIARP
jgi:hypothetical protein